MQGLQLHATLQPGAAAEPRNTVWLDAADFATLCIADKFAIILSHACIFIARSDTCSLVPDRHVYRHAACSALLLVPVAELPFDRSACSSL